MKQIEKGDLQIACKTVGLVETNCYIVGLRGNDGRFLIDPGGDEDEIIRWMDRSGYRPEGILLTHGHFDHILGIEEIKKRYATKVYAHVGEKKLLGKKEWNASAITGIPYELKQDVELKGGDRFTMAGVEVTVLHTPGHTKGGVCYLLKDYDVLFSGDTLFYNSIGRTDLPTANGEQILDSIKNVLFELDDEVRVYPGHGESTSIGYEKEHNTYIL